MNRSLRLVFVCNSAPVLAGTEKTVLLLLDNLEPSEVTARVILNGEGPFAGVLRERGFDVEVIDALGPFGLAWRRGLVASLTSRPADVVQLHASRLNVRLLQGCGARVVERLNMNRHTGFWYPMRWRWLDCFTARWLDHFVVVSESLKDEFVARGYQPDSMSVIYNGVGKAVSEGAQPLREELGLADDCPLVGTIGRLEPQKGMDTFIAVAERIATSDSKIHFVVAGEGQLRQALERQAAAAGLLGRCHFLGHRKDVSPVLADLDVMLVLSRWEPFANTVLEGMRSGKAIVATSTGGNQEALEDERSGLLVPVDNIDATVQAILRLLHNTSLRDRLAEGAAEKVKKYSVERMVLQHRFLYQRVAGETGGSDD